MILTRLLKRAARKIREKQIRLMLWQMALALKFPLEARTALRKLDLSYLSDQELDNMCFGLTGLRKDDKHVLKIMEQIKVAQN